ncbi:MAG: 2-phosphosulfolactate phosphatase [Acidimicrobiia bacterium]
MMIHHLAGIEGASAATGTAVVVDTFRAFATAAFIQASGVERHYLTDTLDRARNLAGGIPGAVLCGEERGRRPDDFDLGNSPAEVLEADLADRVVIQRTSAGTRCVLAAIGATPEPVFAASLVVATATAKAVHAAPEISIVASGRNGTTPTDDDDLTAALLADLLGGTGDPAAVAQAVKAGASAARLRDAAWSHADDVELCTQVDRFAFAMRATPWAEGVARLRRVDPSTSDPERHASQAST